MKLIDRINTYFAKERIKEQIKDKEFIINNITKTIKGTNNIITQIEIYNAVSLEFNKFISKEQERLTNELNHVKAFVNGGKA
jgi:fructose-specific phosphotransferase system component IIB